MRYDPSTLRVRRATKLFVRFSLVLSVTDMLSSACRTFCSNNVKVKLRVVLIFASERRFYMLFLVIIMDSKCCNRKVLPLSNVPGIVCATHIKQYTCFYISFTKR